MKRTRICTGPWILPDCKWMWVGGSGSESNVNWKFAKEFKGDLEMVFYY